MKIMKIKVSDECVGCLGSIMLLILVLLGQGLIIFGLGYVFLWLFNINYTFHYWQAIILGILLSIITFPLRKDK